MTHPEEPMAPSLRTVRMRRPLRAPLLLAAVAALACIAPSAARAQIIPRPGGTGAVVTEPGDTSTRRRRVLPPDTTRVNGLSPKGAFLRSLILPGWGQSRIGAPGRGGIYFGLETGSLWMVYKAQKKVEDARRREHTLHDNGILDPNTQSGLLHSRLSQREDWITLSMFWLFFSGADAYVATHLANFNAHVGAVPTPDGGVQVQATVPVGKKP
ncbi:MAG: hypothetical protein JWM27_288 [Gemmatimonadetes bacterium]|nr:hypothetical protein [Gemmatimonadota bacterium]